MNMLIRVSWIFGRTLTMMGDIVIYKARSGYTAVMALSHLLRFTNLAIITQLPKLENVSGHEILKSRQQQPGTNIINLFVAKTN